MTALFAALAFALLALSIWQFFRPRRQPPELGQLAPEFELPDQHGQIHRLSATGGRWRVLFFYPRDDTPGCTREACDLRDAYAALAAAGVALYGVSVDSVASHAAFAGKFALPYPLLADTDGRVAAAWGCLLRLGPLRFARRRSFIVAPDGRVAARFLQVNPARHAAEIAAALARLQAGV